MKKLSFAQLDGWPASSETWLYFQEMVEQVQSLSLLGGNNYIISGCLETGNNISSGWVVLNGEVLYFAGGLKQDTIVPIQIETIKEFFGGILLPYYLNRQAIFGSGTGQVAWSDMKRNDPGNSILSRLERLERIAAPYLPVAAGDGSFQRGGMMLWKKPAALIPPGWQEVVDWRGRLPLGYNPNDPDFNEVGKANGDKTHSLQRTHLPNVSIPVKGYRGESYTGGPVNNDTNGSGFNGKSIRPNGSTDPLGDGTAVNHMNPFRIVMFIEYTGN